MKKMVTRFAPSPTGYIHIGNLRSAILPYLLARQTDGTYILRIEDTDRARYVEGATELIEETLRWVGVSWDEGPDVGGPNAPYFQTERAAHYEKWARVLIEKGMAYGDPRSPEEMDALRADAASKKQAFLVRNYRPEVLPEWEPGMPLRFKQTELKPVEWDDAVYGKMSAGPEVLDDIILIKKDGLPTYNFGHIIDDYEMGVTHIFRGQEYLSSMPNYLTLYEALEFPRPVFVHMPHILRADGRKKLGKRDGAKSASDYRAEGVLPEAMLNFLACLGWNDGTEQEIYTMEELVAKFSIGRIQRAGARFDEAKLLWMNGQWIRSLSVAELHKRLFVGGFVPEAASAYDARYQMEVVRLLQDRLKLLGDFAPASVYFFADPVVDMSMILANKFLGKFSEQELREMLMVVAAKLDRLSDFTADRVQEVLNSLLVQLDKKPAELFSLVRIAVSFAPYSPSLDQTLALLGREVVLSRLNKVISMLNLSE